MSMLLKAIALNLFAGRTIGGAFTLLTMLMVPLAAVLKFIGLPILLVLGLVGAPIFLLLGAVGLPAMLVVGIGGSLLLLVGVVLAIGLMALKIALPIILVVWLVRWIFRKAKGAPAVAADAPPAAEAV